MCLHIYSAHRAEGRVNMKTARWPCGVCGRGVGNNSVQCTSCRKWVHRKCISI